MSEQENSRNEMIALGHEAEQFRNTPLGQFMADRAQLEIDNAKGELARVDPENTSEIKRLQNIIARHSDFWQWMQDVIHAGTVAYDEYLNDPGD
jgi:hypothetical protein